MTDMDHAMKLLLRLSMHVPNELFIKNIRAVVTSESECCNLPVKVFNRLRRLAGIPYDYVGFADTDVGEYESEKLRKMLDQADYNIQNSVKPLYGD